jgi:hypothetical protein
MGVRIAARTRAQRASAAEATMAATDSPSSRYGRRFLHWIVVSIPLGWGVYATLQKAAQLFR